MSPSRDEGDPLAIRRPCGACAAPTGEPAQPAAVPPDDVDVLSVHAPTAASGSARVKRQRRGGAHTRRAGGCLATGRRSALGSGGRRRNRPRGRQPRWQAARQCPDSSRTGEQHRPQPRRALHWRAASELALREASGSAGPPSRGAGRRAYFCSGDERRPRSFARPPLLRRRRRPVRAGTKRSQRRQSRSARDPSVEVQVHVHHATGALRCCRAGWSPPWRGGNLLRRCVGGYGWRPGGSGVASRLHRSVPT